MNFAIIAVMSLCRNITCESIPGSLLHIHLSMGRGESLRMRLTEVLDFNTFYITNIRTSDSYTCKVLQYGR